MIDGDEVRLEQVVQNLLSNAIKYSPSGGPIVVRVEQHGQQARLLVTDVGMGIPKQDQPHLFQRFYRASNTDTQYMSGMGIGLSVVKEIVTLHGGTVASGKLRGRGQHLHRVSAAQWGSQGACEPGAPTGEHYSAQWIGDPHVSLAIPIRLLSGWWLGWRGNALERIPTPSYAVGVWGR